MTFVTALRRKIKYAGVTQQHVADQLGVTATTVYYWASGRARPTIDNLKRLEEILSCTPGELMVALAYETPDVQDTLA